jgi:LPXTG-motif cell wall-anchored protein
MPPGWPASRGCRPAVSAGCTDRIAAGSAASTYGRAMSIARRAAAALVVLGAGVLAYAVPATASSSGDSPAPQCVDGRDSGNLARYIDAEAGTAWVQGTAPLCAPVEVVLSIYRVPDTWDGHGFNGTAVPQSAIEHAHVMVSGSDKAWVTVDVPTCGNAQIDLYYPPEIDEIDINGTGERLLAGYIWSIDAENGHPKDCAPPSSSTPPPTSPSTPPTSTPPTSTPPTSPSTTSPSTPPSSTPPSSPPAPSTPPSSTGAPIPIPPPVTPPPVTPPTHPSRLAQTGSSSTLPLLGLGLVLLGSGVGLSLLGRRRRTA